MSSGVERQFWESFEGWARRRMAQRLEQAKRWRRFRMRRACRNNIEAARELRLGLAASVARGSALWLPQ